MSVVNLQPYKIAIGSFDYPQQHNNMIDNIELAINTTSTWANAAQVEAAVYQTGESADLAQQYSNIAAGYIAEASSYVDLSASYSILAQQSANLASEKADQAVVEADRLASLTRAKLMFIGGM